MLTEVLDHILTDKHKAVGLYLQEQGTAIFLCQDQLILHVFTHYASIPSILNTADQALNWSMSGINFERKKDENIKRSI